MLRRFLFVAMLRGLILGFSDIGAGGGGAPAAPAAPAAPPAGAPPEGGDGGGAAPPPPAGGAAAPAEGEPDFDDFGTAYADLLKQEGDTITGVPRSILERHAREHQSYRQRYQPIAKAMGALHPDDQTGFVQFLEAMTSPDPALRTEAANWMRNVLDTVSPAQAKAIAAVVDAAPGTAPGQAAADDFDPFDPAQIDKRIEERAKAMFAERDAAGQQERAVNEAKGALEAKAKELGTEHGIEEFGDPTSPEFATLLFTANKLVDVEDPMIRLDKAAEALRDRWAKQGQKLLKAKGSDAAPSPAAPDGAPPAGRVEPKSMDDAAEAAAARIDKILSGQAGT